jgi:two-component system, LytTR family, sensor kinase
MIKSRRIYTVLAHISLWAVLFICVFLFRPHNPGMNEIPITYAQLLVSGLSFMAVFYLHAYWLMPRYLFRKKIGVYALSLAGAWLAAAALPVLFFFLMNDQTSSVKLLPAILRRMLPVQFFIMASASLGAFRETFRLEKNRKVKETEHLRTELSFLRGQVNPHFMLNVLNSMVLLARRKSDLLEPVLMELAGLMSYMLYNTNNEKIGLEDEIKYLQAYIDLQLLRFGDDVTVQFNTSGMLDNRYIEPMLLIPLVENAFKHGIGLVGQPEIGIDIRAEEGDRLSMTVRNKYNPLIGESDNRPTGIGLKNLRKRLELIYPGQFELNTGNNYHVDSALTENWFITTLNIPLQ